MLVNFLVGAAVFLSLGGPIISLANAQGSSGGIIFAGGSGESPDEAIIIKGAKGSGDGIPAEYRYLEQKYGRRHVGWKLVRQSLLHLRGRHFDLMQIELVDGTKKDIYFDITEFFGKF